MDDNPNAFKHGLGEHAVRVIAQNLKRVEGSFKDKVFIKSAMAGLNELELKARVNHLVGALRKHLSDDIPDAIEILVQAGSDWDKGKPGPDKYGFAAWPIIEFVGEHGLDHFDQSMEALRKLTPLFSAEFAVRGFIEQEQAHAFKLLGTWAKDSNHHVRRLVSEGTRPRLPWGKRLKKLVENPRPVIRLLEKLKDDEHEYVRRSVANNLNDIAKDHPDTVVEVCTKWNKRESKDRQWIIQRATRTLIKDGHPGALRLLGYDPDAPIKVSKLKLEPKELSVGDDLKISFEVTSEASDPLPLIIDYAIHHMKANGRTSPKVFKLKTITLKPGEKITVTKTHKFRQITTRKYYPGKHSVSVELNGKSKTEAGFYLCD